MMHAFQERHGVRVLHAWGMTETSPLGSVAHAPAGVTGEEEWAYRYTQGRFPAGKISPDGYLTLVDRSKDVIKSGGEWISSVDLENAVMGHPAVAEAAVIGVPDEKWDERPLVAIVLAEGATAEPTELRDFLADKFAKWQLPEHWTFISEVPKTSVGKFDKKQLRAQYANGELDVKTLA
ncbi:Medium chain fatty-acid-CoA ligase FadD14 [Mycobacteroides abscessus subsp. abscessus]|nr:Medium chain fatty-acid-CoA ligase FadD14 [Mycobacteroides abscessus subsp. abscessus]